MDPTRLRACLLGTALGDAAGLPWENLPADVVRRRVPAAGPLPFPLGGALSDDTEQSVLVALAWARSGGDPTAFADDLRAALRRWLLCAPPGVGFGTLRAILGSFLGRREGVRSEGNGAAMRAAPLGLLVPADRLAEAVAAGSRVTHTAPAAIEGAHAVALAAAGAAPEALADVVRDPVLAPRIRSAVRAAAAGTDVDALAAELGCAGFVTGWVGHTVPVALHLALTRADPVDAVRDAVRQGGDTDSVAAIAGAVCAARAGVAPDPAPLRDAPLDGAAVAAFADAAAAGRGPPDFLGPRLAARNLATFARMVAWLPRRRWT